MKSGRLTLLTLLFAVALAVAPGAAGAATGSLAQNQCFYEHTLTDTCTAANGLGAASVVAESPDGNTVYVGATESQSGKASIAVFSRASDGTLTQLTGNGGKDGCVTTGGAGPGGAGTCTSARGLDEVHDLAVSADNNTVYA